MSNVMSYQLYIASAVPDGGIYRYSVKDSGELLPLGFTPVVNPLYLTPAEGSMYIICRPAPTELTDSGEVNKICRLTYCKIMPDGSLGEFAPFVSTKGTSGCHINVSPDGRIFAANYSSGSVFLLRPDKTSKLLTMDGGSVDPERQQSAHPHQVIFTPDKKYLCVTDLGLDAVILFDFELNEISRAKTPAGHGPRHTVFSNCKKYAYTINELISGVTCFSYSDGALTALDTYSSLPADFPGISYGAAIRLTADGKQLYVSNRGHDSIALFYVRGAELDFVGTFPCGGSWPRDFNLSPDEKFLYCTNERGNNVTCFSRSEDGTLTRLPQTLELSAPLCAAFA